MKRIRYILATIALLAALSGLFPLGVGLGSLANTASSVVAHSSRPVTTIYKPPCPWAGSDC